MVNREPAYLSCRGYHPEAEDAGRIDWSSRARVFVTASAGPMPKQNLQGEMSGQGMESPSAGKIVFNGVEPKITLVRSGQKTARPRFAVACDYIDVMEGGFWEYFKAVGKSGEFEMKICWEKIHPKFPAEKKKDFLKSVTLWMVGDDGNQEYQSKSSELSADGATLRTNFTRKLILKVRSMETNLSDAFFLSIAFSPEAMAGLKGFGDYDFDSPWNIQVGIYNHWGQDIMGSPNAYQNPSDWHIMRHKDFGETPDHKWRAKFLPREYGYQLAKRKS